LNIRISLTFAPIIIAAITVPEAVPFTYAQSEDESETETEQATGQKNVCSGWAICVNNARNAQNSLIEDSGVTSTEDSETLIATPN
jgi:hypothetical protein